MSLDLTLNSLNVYVQETTNFLISRVTRDQSASPPIAGWHNFFKAGRIGTTGTAVPLLFLAKVRADFPFREEAINKLLSSQSSQGSWAILSLGDVSTVEGTAWPMRALAVVGDTRARGAIYRAEEWLLSQQNMEGAWGSTKDNSPRTLLTCISIESLAALSASSHEAITKAIKWFIHNQRPDGSWGAEPGQDGTVFHTALVIKTLFNIGVPAADPHVAAAVSFLKDRWKPNSKNFLQEIYDVHFSGTYSRVITEHDVDSEVIQALLKIRPTWASALLLSTARDMVDLYVREGRLTPSGMQPSIWNIIPRATAFFDLLHYFPISQDGRIMNFKEAIVYSPSSNHLTRRGFASILLRRILIPRFPLTSFLLLFFVMVTVLISYLYYVGSVKFSDVVLSFFVEMAGLSLGLFIDRKRWGKHD